MLRPEVPNYITCAMYCSLLKKKKKITNKHVPKFSTGIALFYRVLIPHTASNLGPLNSTKGSLSRFAVHSLGITGLGASFSHMKHF